MFRAVALFSDTRRTRRARTFRVAAEAVETESAVALAAESATAVVEAQPATVVTSVTQWQSQRSVSKMGRKERSKSLAMRRSMVKATLGAPSLLHARCAFARKRVTKLPVMLQHRAPSPLLPLPSHGLQMAKVRQESGEADSMIAHVMDEHAALQQHLEMMIEPTIKPDSQVCAIRVAFCLRSCADIVLCDASTFTDTVTIVAIAVCARSGRGLRSCPRVAQERSRRCPPCKADGR